MLPYEEENRQQLQADFGQHFDGARDLIGITLVLLEKIRVTPRSDAVVKTLLLSLGTRAIRQYRSIVALCELGLLENAQILTRSLFEGLLVERFVLDSPPQQLLAPIPPGVENQRFRVLLYLAAGLFNENHRVRRICNTPTGRDVFTPQQLTERDQMEAQRAAEIGPEWARMLRRRPHTYSGRTIAGMAAACRLEEFYANVYPIHSTKAHAGDITDFVGRGNGAIQIMLAIDCRLLPSILGLASGVLGVLLHDLDRGSQTGLHDDIEAAARTCAARLAEGRGNH